MTLDPTFDKDVVEYSATTNNATNQITATPEDPDATVEITCGDKSYESGDAIEWAVGDNRVEVKVTNGSNSKTYGIDVHKPSAEAKITSFVIGSAEGVIDESAHTVTVEVPSGTEVTALEPTIAVSDDASVSPASGVAQDFTSPVTYTVTAEAGNTQDYAVTVNVAS